MPSIRVREIVIDYPREKTDDLLAFYAALTGYTPHRSKDQHPSLLQNDRGIDIGLQPVDGYQPPTWPTQERGQQVHLDFATRDLDAAARFAESIGATKADLQPAEDDPDEDFIVMIDPVGHPFCFVKHVDGVDVPLGDDVDGKPAIAFRMPFIDCPDHRALAAFYADLLGGTTSDGTDDEYAVVHLPDGGLVGLQRVEGYRPPTWPTQERGQQEHMDLAVDNLAAAKALALSLGATIAHEPPGNDRHVVMLDPAGHPFCLGLDVPTGG